MAHEPLENAEIVSAEKAEWVAPVLTRMTAGEAQSSGATSDDGVIGNS